MRCTMIFFIFHAASILQPSAVIFNMTNSREMAQFYVYAIFTLLAIVILTTLHVLFIAFRKINNPTINPEKKTESSDVGSGEQISSNDGKYM